MNRGPSSSSSFFQIVRWRLLPHLHLRQQPSFSSSFSVSSLLLAMRIPSHRQMRPFSTPSFFWSSILSSKIPPMFLEKVQRLQIGLFGGFKKLMVRRNGRWNSYVEEVTWSALLPKIDFSSAADFVERSLAAECFLYLIKNIVKDGSVN